MTRTEAMMHATGYASGREDASGTATTVGYFEFAQAYGAAWEEYNAGKRSYMTNCRAAYDAWQASGGRTIFLADLGLPAVPPPLSLRSAGAAPA